MKKKDHILNILFILLLATASTWLIGYGLLQRQIAQQNYSYTNVEAQQLNSFAAAQYAFGRKAHLLNDLETATQYYRIAVSVDPLQIGAWLKLAEVRRDLGDVVTARKIVRYTHNLAGKVLRWKWSETLLAHELDMEGFFRENVNYLVSHNKMTSDAIRLAYRRYFEQDTSVIAVLQPENRVAYLEWLMRWNRVDGARSAWASVREKERNDPTLRIPYVHFLIGHNHVDEARTLWNSHADQAGITNAGFEEELLLSGFGWRSRNPRDDQWITKRVRDREMPGNHVLQIGFSGKENVTFHHFYQIVAVDALQPYRLSYRYRSKEITTDQGPFVEISGYNCEGLYEKGPMILGSNEWQEETMAFVVPETCKAIVVRLRRARSHRFDCKIKGTLWLDDFRLEPLGEIFKQTADAASEQLKVVQ